MTKPLTAGELRAALAGVPDDLEVRLCSDTGVDQGLGQIIIESAERVQYVSGGNAVDYFSITANDCEEDDQYLPL